jgi:predicted DNA-binding protein with PD1-like motif
VRLHEPDGHQCRLPHRAGHLLKRAVFRTGEVMVLEDPGRPAGDIGTDARLEFMAEVC